MEQGGPVEDVQVPGAGSGRKTSLASEPLPCSVGHETPKGTMDREVRSFEPAPHQRQVANLEVRIQERLIAPGDPKRRRVHGWWWLEGCGGDAAFETERPPGEPAERGEVARPDGCSFACRLELHDQIRSNQRRAEVIEQPSEHIRGYGERDVPEGPERLRRVPHVEDIRLYHL